MVGTDRWAVRFGGARLLTSRFNSQPRKGGVPPRGLYALNLQLLVPS